MLEASRRDQQGSGHVRPVGVRDWAHVRRPLPSQDDETRQAALAALIHTPG